MNGAKATTWNWSWLNSTYNDDEVCVRLTKRQLAALLTATQPMVWRTRWFEQPPDFDDVQNFVGDLQRRLIDSEECYYGQSSSGGNSDNNDRCSDDFSWWLYRFREYDVKFRTPDGEIFNAVIELVPDTCAGTGDGTGTGTPPNVPGGTSGDVGYGDFLTLCDIVTGYPDILLDDMDDFLGRLQTLGLGIELAVDIGASVFSTLVEDVLDNLNVITGELNDPDFVAIVRKAIARTFDDPITSPVTREQMRSFVNKLPQVFEGALMWSAFTLWVNQVNLGKVNAQWETLKGAGTQDVCEPVFIGIGRAQFQPSVLQDFSIETLDQSAIASGFVAYKIDIGKEILSTDFFLALPTPDNEVFRGFSFVDWYLTNASGGFSGGAITFKRSANDEREVYTWYADGDSGNWHDRLASGATVQTIADSLYSQYGSGFTRSSDPNSVVPLSSNDVTELAIESRSKYVNTGTPLETWLGTLFVISERI